jgi:hypothetical protein
MLLMTGVALPWMLAHTNIITDTAAVMSFLGGMLIYVTSTSHSHALTPVIAYGAFFHSPEDL